MHKISVITIVKDNESLIPRAIDSVLSQSFDDFELIIINDGSSDRTKDIIDSYEQENKRIRSWHLVTNVGRSKARNTGLKKAQGTYIFFLDSDDYLPKSALADLYDIAAKYKSDIVYGGFKCFDHQTGQWTLNHYTDRIINREKHNFRLDDYPDLINNHHIVGRLYLRKFIRVNNIQFSNARKNGEDVLFSFYTAFFAKNISMVPNKIVYYYSIGRFLSAATESKLFDARENILETRNFALENGSAAIMRAMRIKCAFFACDLKRAVTVYQNNDRKLINYIETLKPLVDNLSEDEITFLPHYYKLIINALKRNNPQKVYGLFLESRNDYYTYNENLLTDNNSESIDANLFFDQINNLKIINKELSYKLDALYNSTSWRITAPIRNFMLFLKSFSKRTPGVNFEKSISYESGLDLSLDENDSDYGVHRSGWNFAINSLRPMHNSNGVYFVSFLEKVFCWNDVKPVIFPRAWIGLSHRPPNIPEWYPEENRRLFFENKYFSGVSDNCQGIFTLSEYHANYLREKLPIKIDNIFHPTEIPERQWNVSSLNADIKKVVQIGWWLRKLHAIFMLPPGKYKKIYLSKASREPIIKKVFNLEAQNLRKEGNFNSNLYDGTEFLDFLSNEQYDQLLSSSIVFLDLYDSSANNVIIEAIARSTPIIVNPLKPVIEYLGESYPLYYECYEEASEKLNNSELLYSAHEYLKTCPSRKKITNDYFLKSIKNSYIYKDYLNSHT